MISPSIFNAYLPTPFFPVLESITLNTAASAKFVSSTGRSVDLSKITVLNPLGSVKGSGATGNVVLLPDGQMKSIAPPPKSLGRVFCF